MAKNRMERVGRVVSDKMEKTVVIAVETRRAHPLYGKIVTHTTKLHVHDPGNAAKVGDKVRIIGVRPLSKTKRWRVKEIIAKEEKAEVNLEPGDLKKALRVGDEE